MKKILVVLFAGLIVNFVFAGQVENSSKIIKFQKLDEKSLAQCQKNFGGKTERQLNEFLYSEAGFKVISDFQYSDLDQQYSFLEKKIRLYNNSNLSCICYAKAALLFNINIKDVYYHDAMSFFADIQIQQEADLEKFQNIGLLVGQDSF